MGSRPYTGLLVPDQAVVNDQSRQVVYVVGADGKVAERLVELGPLLDGLRVIRSGIAPTDRVIIEGVQHAQPGKPVTVARRPDQRRRPRPSRARAAAVFVGHLRPP